MSGGRNRLVIEFADLAAAMAALRATGARFRSEPLEAPGGRQVLVDNLAGNPVELCEAVQAAEHRVGRAGHDVRHHEARGRRLDSGREN